MLKHGLVAAILVHSVYDMIVFTIAAIVLAFRNDLSAW